MHKLIKKTCAIAAKELGKERAGLIAKAAQQRYEELCAENKSDSKALRAHTFTRIYPSIAVYEALLAEGLSHEKAFYYVREYFQQVAAKVVPHLQRVIKVLHLARFIPGVFMKISLKSFGPDAGFGYEFPKSQGNEARFHIVKCPYYETCKRYGHPEIVPAFCDGDDAGYGNMHPSLIWGRKKTIGRGDDCCDFLLEYRED